METSDFDFQSWEGKLFQFRCSAQKNEQSRQITEFEIRRGSDFWQLLSDIRQKYKPYENEIQTELWYRGQNDEDFVLLPSLIRNHYHKKIKYSLPQYQRTLFERFLARSRNSVELRDLVSPKRKNEQIEYIADMQHYSIPTNLLDWSESAGVSLYFATEKQNDRIIPEKAAAFYVLHPYLYNLVRGRVIDLYLKEPQEVRYQHNRKTVNSNLGVLPNFSAHFNVEAKQYENYIFGPELWNAAGPNDYLEDPFANEDECDRINAPLLPLAITVPCNNPRILSQRGTFLAFNLCEYPLKENDKRFLSYRHIELSKIQEFYLKSKRIIEHEKAKRAQANQIILDKVPFLHKIVIDPSVVAGLREIATALGNKRATIYPELYHIGEEIKESVL